MTPIPPIQHTPRPCFALRHPIAARRVRRSLKAVAILGWILATCSVIALVCSLWVSIQLPATQKRMAFNDTFFFISRGNISSVCSSDLLPINSEKAIGITPGAFSVALQPNCAQLHDVTNPLVPQYQLCPYSDSLFAPPPPIIPFTLWHDHARTVIALWLPSTIGLALTLPHRLWRHLLTTHPAICSHCAYDLKGLSPHARCPECGTAPIASESTNSALAALSTPPKHNGPSSRQGR